MSAVLRIQEKVQRYRATGFDRWGLVTVTAPTPMAALSVLVQLRRSQNRGG